MDLSRLIKLHTYCKFLGLGNFRFESFDKHMQEV